jgi:hypothetical protein
VFLNKINSPCAAGQKDEVNSTSVRIVIFISYVTPVVLLAAFSAFLISSLAVQPRHLPFRDLQGLVNDGSYRLGVVQNSYVLTIFDVCLRKLIIFKSMQCVMYVCMHVYTYICMYYECMYICTRIYVCMYGWMDGWMEG